jgi:methyltransferase family protein
MKISRLFAYTTSTLSLSTKMRRKRLKLFKNLLSLVPRPVRIIDVGGEPIFWERMGGLTEENLNVLLLNLSKLPIEKNNFQSVAGDARNMKMFKDEEFDVAFSNSVIEHVGTFEQQSQMAKEVRRICKRYFIQTPNRYFPIEPHFLFPFFQFLPMSWKVSLIKHFDLGWTPKIKDRRTAEELFRPIRLLTKKELKHLFPDSKIYKEKFLGLTKSFVVYGGW